MNELNRRADGSVGIIELARPAVFNCLSMAVFGQMEAALDDFEADPAIRSVLIRAQGKHFCTGAELGEVKAVRESELELTAFLELGHRVLQRFEASPLPVVAAVQGLCLAGGLELVFACDFVFAAVGAKFGDQHAQFGLVPGWGASQRLPRLIGLRRAMDLYLSVRWIDAATAESWGLVNRVVPEDELAGASLAFTHGLAERSRVGLAEMKFLARRGLEGSLADGLALERSRALAPLQSADVAEGIAAFEEKRKPHFA